MPLLHLNGSIQGITCNEGHKCIPKNGPGAILYNGNITIMSIAGRYWPEKASGDNYDLVPWITYLDFPSKQIKFAFPMDEKFARYKHCTVPVNESTVFVFGGIKRDDLGNPTEIAYDGYFMHFSNHEEPNEYKAKVANFTNEFPCGQSYKKLDCGQFYPARACALKINNITRLLHNV